MTGKTHGREFRTRPPDTHGTTKLVCHFEAEAAGALMILGEERYVFLCSYGKASYGKKEGELCFDNFKMKGPILRRIKKE